MPQPAANPEPSPAPLAAAARRARERQEAIDAYNARRAELGLPQIAPQKAPAPDPYAGMAGDLAKAMRSMEQLKREVEEREEREAKAEPAPKARSAHEIIEQARQSQRARQEREASGEPAPEPQSPAEAEREAGSARQMRPKAEAPAPKGDIITNFPIIPASARAVVNEIASSALFAAIQGKDRKLVKDMPVAATGETQMFFTGELLNQDDHDVFMQLVYLASAEPLGAYVPVSGHSLLKALGRGTSGKEHQQLDAEIERLKNAGVKIKVNRYTYIGSLIHDAIKNEVSGHWIYRLNENLLSLYGASGYTLIDWEQRKRLKGKDLARWLQLEIARHALPFPIKVETLRGLCGSQAKELRGFRQSLKQALAVLQAEGHIAAWHIDENDLVHVDRGAALTASQRRSLALPKPRGKKS